MPEGHSVHRIARQFRHNFQGKTVRASSPQGRFAEGAAVLDGRTITDVDAVGKQMFMHFGDDVWLRVHGDATAVQPLVALLSEPTKHVRQAAVEALGCIGDRTARSAVAQLLGDPERHVRDAAAEALRRMDR